MTNKEIINEILAFTNIYNKNDLLKLKKIELNEILNDVSIEDEGLEFGDDYVEDPTIERTLVESVTHPYDEVDEEEEEIVIDISKLSVVEQRAYRRTGQLPKITYNRYTRFDDESPKMSD